MSNKWPGKVVNGNMYVLPMLVSVDKTGRKLHIWSATVSLIKDEMVVPIEASHFNGQINLPNGMVAQIMVYTKQSVSTSWRDGVATIIDEGKNKGRANQTNAFTQAVSEANSKYKKHKDHIINITKPEHEFLPPSEAAKINWDIYFETFHGTSTSSQISLPAESLGESTLYLPPMLAQSFETFKDEFVGKLFVQRKLDGIRCIATRVDGVIHMYTRNLKPMGPQLDFLKPDIAPIFDAFDAQEPTVMGIRSGAEIHAPRPRLYLDGELYTHGHRLQDIVSATRNEKAAKAEGVIEYHIYDLFVVRAGTSKADDLPFNERKILLDNLFKSYKKHPKTIQQVETVQVSDETRLLKVHEQFVAEKYEGTMVRLNKPYLNCYKNYHCPFLLKMKPRQTDEFIICGYADGKGKNKGVISFIVKTKEGEEFGVVPAVPTEQRRALYEKMGTVEKNGKTHFDNEWLGKPYTVSFLYLSKKGIPVHPVGVALRTYE